MPPGGMGGQPPMGGGAPMGGPPMGGAPMAGGGPPAGDAPNFILWIILGAVQALLCQNWLFGLPAAILAFLGKSDWDGGNAEGAQKKLKISKIIFIIGMALYLLGVIGYLIFVFVVVGSGAATSY